MLNSVRKVSNNVIFRIFLLVILLAFATWGIKDIAIKKTNPTIVKFKSSQGITREEILKRKSLIPAQNNNDNAKNIEILKVLINEKLLEEIANYYNFHVPQDYIRTQIKTSPNFIKDNKFDKKSYEQFLRHLHLQEKDYIKQIENNTIRNILYTSLFKNAPVSKALFKEEFKYNSEIRVIDLVTVDLNKQYLLNMRFFSEDELKEFYNAHKEQFRLPEYRNIRYITIENQKTKQNKNLDHLIETLDDVIASGASLDEIAKKFNYKIHKDKVSKQDHIISPKILKIAFELDEQELSYPIVENDKVYVLEVNSIEQSKIPLYESIKSEVSKACIKQYKKEANINIAKELVKSENFIEKAKKLKFDIKKNINVKRSIVNQYIPDQFKNVIFNTKKGEKTQLYIDNNYAYIGHVKNIKYDMKKFEEYEKNESILHYRKNLYFESMFPYFIEKINLDDL